MLGPDLSPAQTRAQDESFVRLCAFRALRPNLPLRWPTPSDTPDSPKRRYRSHYRYLGCEELDDLANWEHLSPWDLVVRLVDFALLRPWLAWRLGWTSARGQVPFDPVSMFLFISWQLVHGWSRAQALRNLRHPRYADVAQRMGFHPGIWPTEGGVRYFLTTLGLRSDAEAKTVSVAVRDEQGQEYTVEVAVQALNGLLVAAVTLLRQAHHHPRCPVSPQQHTPPGVHLGVDAPRSGHPRFRQPATSLHRLDHRIYHIGTQGFLGKRQRCLDRLSGQTGMRREKLIDRFSSGQLFQDELDRDACSSNDLPEGLVYAIGAATPGL